MRSTLAAVAAALLLASSARAQAPEPLDEKACLAVAKKIEAAVQSADPKAFDEVLNLNALLENVLKGIEAEEKTKKDFLEGATEGSLGDQLAEQVKAGAKFRFLRLHAVNGRTCALFRLVNANGGVNYHDYILAKDGEGAKAEDLYVYLMGESLSRTFKREFLKVVAITTKAPGNLKGWEKDIVDAQPKIAEMQAAAGAGKAKKAMKAYRDLPQSVQEDKLIMIQRVAIALQAGEAEYKEALDAWEKLFPGDPSMDLMKIDAFAMKKDYDASAASAERLAKTIGGDPFLDALRGGIFLQADKLDEAAACAEKSAKEEKGISLAQFVLLQVSLRKKDHAGTARALTALENECEVPIGEIEEEDEFADFVESDEYAKWKEGRK